MSNAVRTDRALIGPNAVLQAVPVLDRIVGRETRDRVLARAALHRLPDGTRMIPETLAASLHRVIRQELPQVAPQIGTEAGIATANYILARRIPKLAQGVLRCLPPGASAALLSRAISKHAWTFAGTGSFRVVTPWVFEIHDNPLIRGEADGAPMCHWHTAVFARLYQALVSSRTVCQEVVCGAQGGGVCRFELWLHPRKV
ncbi:bacteriochlorophyll synthase 23 kDa chain [Jannaschia pagri]|uniref:Bacteriochlorophyll synthase 23 kDa chain n=1 Tax=Jannaschia pagri TaxID=2829797 RepID=A0ABQ4NPC9_9RHOB|nr:MULTISPECIES: bacteriochlorophyll 4-vinyl reductase [unclassified Jannaschia]GIT92433.1 bacteriochlorophyll synthase 23 kDa chain [Jannaschia sp. AI_61]GIT96268.1 bacteriochlorophyll synthase 23 kDa chain [Jannaschia sp. AI_62]